MTQPRMLTGDRPTGQLHLGHYVGTLKNRIKYQHNYESFFLVADLHMLTTRNRTEDIQGTFENARHLVLDALAAGIEPETVICGSQAEGQRGDGPCFGGRHPFAAADIHIQAMRLLADIDHPYRRNRHLQGRRQCRGATRLPDDSGVRGSAVGASANDA